MKRIKVFETPYAFLKHYDFQLNIYKKGEFPVYLDFYDIEIFYILNNPEIGYDCGNRLTFEKKDYLYLFLSEKEGGFVRINKLNQALFGILNYNVDEGCWYSIGRFFDSEKKAIEFIRKLKEGGEDAF